MSLHEPVQCQLSDRAYWCLWQIGYGSGPSCPSSVQLRVQGTCFQLPLVRCPVGAWSLRSLTLSVTIYKMWKKEGSIFFIQKSPRTIRGNFSGKVMYHLLSSIFPLLFTPWMCVHPFPSVLIKNTFVIQVSIFTICILTHNDCYPKKDHPHLWGRRPCLCGFSSWHFEKCFSNNFSISSSTGILYTYIKTRVLYPQFFHCWDCGLAIRVI